MTKVIEKSLTLILILMVFSGNVIGVESSDTFSRPDAYESLFIGNSHSANNGLPDLVATLIETGLPGKSANSTLSPGYGYLSDRLSDGVTQQALESRSWTHVILQAQKYSTSGRYHYPTDAAEIWIRRVKERNARPILFPEWPRKGNKEEGRRVHNLHLGISSREPACVAPIGLAWEESIARYPGLNLYDGDGDHSNLSGALLSAYVFYELFTGQRAVELPYIPEIKVSAESQQKLADVASFVVETNHETCNELLTEFEFVINAGLNDAWFNPATNGQGFLITVFPDKKEMFLAWFTYDTKRPPEDVTAMLGEPGHRWLTAQGPYDGDTANLTVFVTEGGVFDAAVPVAETDQAGDGSMTIEFADCSEGLVNYQITSLDISGEIPIQRITPDNVPLCEALEEQLLQ